MGLQIDLTSTGNTTGVTAMTTTAGATITSANIRIRKIEQEDETRIDLRLRMWLTEQDFDDGNRDVWVDEIPLILQNLSASLTPSQYANADNGNIQNNVRKLLEDGDNSILWSLLIGNNLEPWAGLGENTVTVIMPA